MNNFYYNKYIKRNINTILSDYPRPLFVRDSYYNLNGEWFYKVTSSIDFPNALEQKIIVPFPIESKASNVEHLLLSNEFLHYEKKFIIDKEFLKDLTFLNFGAVDQYCLVYLNDHVIGEHYGGYLPFSLDITNYLKIGENTLRVSCVDKTNDQFDFAYGKQSYNRGGIWYTPCSGIWQTVWLESLPSNYLKDLKITPDLDNSQISVDLSTSQNNEGFIIIKDEAKELFKVNIDKEHLTIKLPNFENWSPENPKLYYMTIYIKNNNTYDIVNSYFALRKYSITTSTYGPCLALNNQPYFYNGLLDQGYYPDGIYTPTNYEVMIHDISQMKALGYNTLRKHIKIEPSLWYFFCDTLGMIVFQDFVNSGKYSFLQDTILPTVGFKKVKDNNLPFNKTFEQEMIMTLNHLYNIPSIALWTIFNEGWGQHQSAYYYNLIKGLDKTRFIDTNSGWFDQKASDVNSKHIYFKKININPRFDKDSRPLIISEFGGYSYKLLDHCFNINKTYGYRYFNDQNKFQIALINLYENEILPMIKKGLSCAIYTQVSDVEDETNGLLTYDREVLKIDSKVLKETLDKCKI